MSISIKGYIAKKNSEYKTILGKRTEYIVRGPSGKEMMVTVLGSQNATDAKYQAVMKGLK